MAKVNEATGGPAFMFENVKDHDTPVFCSAFTTKERLAIALEQARSLSMSRLGRTWMERTAKGLNLPRVVNDARASDNVLDGAVGAFRSAAPGPDPP